MFCMGMFTAEIDQINFERIYRKYYDSVFRRAYTILHNQQDTEDVVQETWTKVLENIEMFRGKNDQAIGAYIMRIARNQSITVLRKRGREKKLIGYVGISEADEMDIVDESELFCICDEQEKDMIIECMRSLDTIYSDVLVYYYLYEYSVKDIAKLLDVTEAAVWKRLSRGRAMLIKMLKRRGLHE